MSNTNYITKSVLELIGDVSPNGYILDIDDSEIPVLLNKDFCTEYPQIRVSPFVDKYEIEYQKYIEKSYQKYRHWEGAVFQVDIFSKTIIEAHNIYDTLQERLYDFFNLETLIYEWSPQFELVEEYTYRNAAYAVSYHQDDLFKDIYSITIDDIKLKRVDEREDLYINSFYVNNHYLYVCTNKNIKNIKIKVLLQGRLFNDGHSYSDRGIHYYEVINQKNLSALEQNEVERISFDLGIIFSHKREREKLPKVNRIKYPKKHHVR